MKGGETQKLIQRNLNGSSNNYAELYAIYAVLSWAVRHNTGSCELHIFTDSQVAITALTATCTSPGLSEIILDIRRQKERLASTTVVLHWIPSHLDAGGMLIQGNELADRLAKESRDSEPKELLHPCGVHSHITRLSAGLVSRIERRFGYGPPNGDAACSPIP